MSKWKERVSVTLTRPYLDFMNRCVENGMYLYRASVVMAALQLLADKHGVLLFPEEE